MTISADEFIRRFLIHIAKWLYENYALWLARQSQQDYQTKYL